MKFTTLSELAAALNKATNSSRYNAWEKGDKKRIYIQDAGYNTKKMSTKVYIDLSGNAPYLNVYIECPSQSLEWIESQKKELQEQFESKLRYCRRHFDFGVATQPVDVVMNNALLAAEEVKGYYTEWREVRVAINSYGKLAMRNRQFVLAFKGTKDTAPRGFVELSPAAYEILAVVRGGEDMLEPYGSVPDYDHIARIRAEHIAKQ